MIYHTPETQATTDAVRILRNAIQTYEAEYDDQGDVGNTLYGAVAYLLFG